MNRWIAVYAPANTPRALIDRLNAEINTALKLPDAMQCLTNQVLDPWPSTADEFAWVAWFNARRLHGAWGYIPPAEAEANYYRSKTRNLRGVVST